MSNNIYQALENIDVALGGIPGDALNIVESLTQIGEGIGSLKQQVEDINSMNFHICNNEEFDAETGIPTIQNPDKSTFYLTPASNQEDNNIFNEYYITEEDEWELFGSASIDINSLFDLSDRMAKGKNDSGEIVAGAIIEGDLSGNKASGYASHAEGASTTASGNYSHAEGSSTTASGYTSHAEGQCTTASGDRSHAEGYYTTASGDYSHAEGYGTIANNQSQHVFGEYNIEDTKNDYGRGTYVEIVGRGSFDHRLNARTLDWNGNEALAGSLTLGKGTTDEVTITAAQLKRLLATLS